MRGKKLMDQRFHLCPPGLVLREERAPCWREGCSTMSPATHAAFEEGEPCRCLQLLEVPPDAAIGHAALRCSLAEGAQCINRLQQLPRPWPNCT